MLFQEPETRTAWPHWRPPSSRLEDRREMTDLFQELCALSGLEMDAKITANMIQQGLRRHCVHEFTSPLSGIIETNTFIEMACDEMERMKKRAHTEGAQKSVLQTPTQPALTTEPHHPPPRRGVTHNEANNRTPRSNRRGGSRSSPSV